MRKTHWLLALALVIFMQVTLASHHHDELSTTKHDCVLCSQHHLLDALPATDPLHTATVATQTEILFSYVACFTQTTKTHPPVRGPPLISNV